MPQSQVCRFGLRVVIDADNNGGRTIIDDVGGAAGTPINIVRRLRQIHRLVAFVTGTEASATSAFATAIIVGEDVVLTVAGVQAGADPGDG